MSSEDGIIHLNYPEDENADYFDVFITKNGEVLFPRGKNVAKSMVMDMVKNLTNSKRDAQRIENFLNEGDKVKPIIGEELCG